MVLLAAGLVAAEDSPPDEKPAPWVLITKDGHRIDALARPERRDGRALIRLSPRGQLTSVPEASIDWDASERYNAPRPAAPPAPAEEEVLEEQVVVPPEAAGEVEPVEMTIIGSKVTAAPIESEAPGDAEAGEAEAREGSPDAGAAPADSPGAGEATADAA